MTPAINAAKRARVAHQVHEYAHDPRAPSYGLEAAEALGQDPAQVSKTLLADLDGQRTVVAILPVESRLDLKALAAAGSAKKAAMTDPDKAQRLTGYVVGGIRPVGQKRKLRTFVDVSAERFDAIFASAGKRGLELELAPADLLTLTAGVYAPLRRQ